MPVPLLEEHCIQMTLRVKGFSETEVIIDFCLNEDEDRSNDRPEIKKKEKHDAFMTNLSNMNPDSLKPLKMFLHSSGTMSACETILHNLFLEVSLRTGVVYGLIDHYELENS